MSKKFKMLDVEEVFVKITYAQEIAKMLHFTLINAMFTSIKQNIFRVIKLAFSERPTKQHSPLCTAFLASCLPLSFVATNMAYDLRRLRSSRGRGSWLANGQISVLWD